MYFWCKVFVVAFISSNNNYSLSLHGRWRNKQPDLCGYVNSMIILDMHSMIACSCKKFSATQLTLQPINSLISSFIYAHFYFSTTMRCDPSHVMFWCYATLYAIHKSDDKWQTTSFGFWILRKFFTGIVIE